MNSYTRKIYFKQEEVADTGPSVNSTDIEQRIAARRIRIINRLEQKRLDGIEQESESNKEEYTISKKQIDISGQRISKLIRDGDSFITNVRVACDARENLRRTEEDELNATRIDKLQDDAREGLVKFNEITKKWEEVPACELPQEMREEIKAKDDQYVRELKKRTEDVDLLTERMESQIQAMQKTYREELVAIEKALVAQKDKLVVEQNEEWQLLMNEIKNKQISYLEEHRIRVEAFDKELHELRDKNTEEYNALKISLESEVETLEAQLLQLKATYLLNLEKLEYNFQVLKRRDEENMITKSNQKRKITRMQDTLNNLHVKGSRQEKQYSFDNEQLSEDYKKRMENFRSLQKKSKLLIETEHRNFRDIWIMNEDHLKKLCNHLLEANQVINEQQLGLPWIRPDVSFMCNIGPLAGPVDQITCKSPAVIAMRYAFQSDNPEAGESRGKSKFSQRLPTSLNEVSPEMVRDFLQLLCYEPEFLIEEKLKRLLKPLPHEEEILMRLDTILTALGVTTEDDLNYLFTHFIVEPSRPAQKDKQLRFTKVIHLVEPEATVARLATDSSSEMETQPVDTVRVTENEGLNKSDEENPGISYTSTEAAVACDGTDDQNIRTKHASVRTGRTSEFVEDPFDTKGLWETSEEEKLKDTNDPESEAERATKLTSPTEITEITAFHAEETDESYQMRRRLELISPVNVVRVLQQFTRNMDQRERSRCPGSAAAAAASKSRTTDSVGASEGGLTQGQTQQQTTADGLRGSLSDTKTMGSSVGGGNAPPPSAGVEADKRDDSHDSLYWAKYANQVVSAETESVWDNLYVAFQRYLCILKHRAKLIRDAESLRRQNEELRHLLQQYLSAPVNYELCVPPANTMKVE